MGAFYDIDMNSRMAKAPHEPVDSDPNPFVWVDMNKCIQCTRCVRACAEIQGRFVWSQSYRGYKPASSPAPIPPCSPRAANRAGHAWPTARPAPWTTRCRSTPVAPDRLVRTTCTYCGVGCQLDLNVKDDVPAGGSSGSRPSRRLRLSQRSAPVREGSLRLRIHPHPRRHTRPPRAPIPAGWRAAGRKDRAARGSTWIGIPPWTSPPKGLHASQATSTVRRASACSAPANTSMKKITC